MLKSQRTIRKLIRSEKGASFIEIILIIVILGITMLPLSRLAMNNIISTGNHSTMTRAMYYAQEVMEQVIADYAATDGGRGYTWVMANWDNQSASGPPAGLSSLVTIGTPDTLDGITYAPLNVTVSGSDIENIQLSTWLIEN